MELYLIRLAIRHGHPPSWVETLSRDDVETLLAMPEVDQYEADRRAMLDTVRRYGGADGG